MGSDSIGGRETRHPHGIVAAVGAPGRARRGQTPRLWSAALRRAKVPYFRVYDLRSTYATRLSAGGVADEWVTQLLRQGDAKVFKKYSQMKLQMKRDALRKIDRTANECGVVKADEGPERSFATVLRHFRPESERQQ